MDEVELMPWHTHGAPHGGWSGDRRDDLEAMMGRPGGEQRLRSMIEPELGHGADLWGSALLDSALDLLDSGRLVLRSSGEPALAVDPHHPIGEGTEDLGNLIDLMGERRDEEPEVERPTWIEIAVVDRQGNPIRGRGYRLQLPDGSVRSGTLGDQGIIRFDDVDPGECILELLDADPVQEAAPPALAA